MDSKIEEREIKKIDLDGNGWIISIADDNVRFEGLYGQGEGGAVTLNQFKFAIQTYMRFLSDPQLNSIEVDFY